MMSTVVAWRGRGRRIDVVGSVEVLFGVPGSA
jgi:hypothetical protein